MIPSFIGYTAPDYEPDEKKHRRRISDSLKGMINGKINCHIDVTLTPSSTTTVITDSRISPYSVLAPSMPLTSDGATAVKNGIWISGLNNGQATANHASNAAVDQTIRFLIIG